MIAALVVIHILPDLSSIIFPITPGTPYSDSPTVSMEKVSHFPEASENERRKFPDPNNIRPDLPIISLIANLFRLECTASKIWRWSILKPERQALTAPKLRG